MDFDAEKFPNMRLTIYSHEEDGKDIVMLCVIDFKTLIHSTDVGQFVDIAPCIVKHLYVHPKMGKHNPSITTVVPKGSFRIAKMPMVDSYTTRVCIIPPKALDGKIKKVLTEEESLDPFSHYLTLDDLEKPETGETRIFATINNAHYIVDVPTQFTEEIKENNDTITKEIFEKIDLFRKQQEENK